MGVRWADESTAIVGNVTAIIIYCFKIAGYLLAIAV